jgi:hypothetical protein
MPRASPIYAAAAAATLPAVALAQSACPASCSGTTADGTAFDLSSLMSATDYTTTDSNGDVYTLNVCGTSQTSCPDDSGDPPVTQGSGVQTTGGNGCYVLGNYEGDNCQWNSNPGGKEGVQLILDDGSNFLCANGSPRQLTVDFICDASGPKVDPSWTATNAPQSCDYTYTFKTPAACSGSGASPSAGPGASSAWASAFLIVTFAAVLPLYIVGAALYNYKVKGARGAEIMQLTPTFWGSLFTNVKAGVSFTLSGFKTEGGSGGGGGAYDGMGPKTGSSSADSYQTGSQP